jgi:hypothetical protein
MPAILRRTEGLTLRQAALVAGLSYLLMPVSYAEFAVFPRLLVAGDIEQTAQRIVAHGDLFVVAILCNLVTLILDVVIAWALYILLEPVNPALSLLTAWFRLMYTGVALFGVAHLFTVFRLLKTPYFLKIFGSEQLHAQAQLLLSSFRYDWNAGLVLFGIHLGLLGYLICRSRYIPRVLGAILIVVGVAWVVNSFRPYLYPDAPLGFIPMLGFGELLLPLWLVIRGSRIADPPEAP